MRFGHARFEVDDTPAQRGIGAVYRPLVLVHLFGPAGELRIQGLLDTGADETIISRDMADQVGLVCIPGAASLIHSAGGDVPLEYARATFEIALDQRWSWTTSVGIAEQPWDVALLGFRGFMEYFDAAFLGHALEFELVRNTRPFAE